jgi:hypothetical protein
MSCPMKRWKVGSCGAPTKNTTPSTEQSKELDAKLKQLRADRASLDAMWETTEEGETLLPSTTPNTQSQQYIRK